MGDLNCFKCGKPGHWARECYSKIKRDPFHFVADKEVIKNKVTRCFICRKLGHLARECPSGDGKYFDIDRPIETGRRGEAPQGFNSRNLSYVEMDDTAITEAFESIDEREWDFMKNENSKELPVAHSSRNDHKVASSKQEDSKYFKSVCLSNTKFNGFLDTCSEKCLIKYSAAKKARLNVQLDDTDVMFNSPTFKSKIVSIGKATTTMCVDSVEVANVDLFVVNDDVLNTDIVVGRSWLDDPHVMVLKMENTVYLADITVQPFDKFRSILSNIDLKPIGKKNADSRLEVISSSEDEAHDKASKKESVPKKRRRSHSKSDYKVMHEHSPRKPSRDLSYEREPDRDILRGRSRERIRSRSRDRIRSRSRDRIREPLRDERMPKLSERSRRSRDRSRSRDRYMSRHSGRH